MVLFFSFQMVHCLENEENERKKKEREQVSICAHSHIFATHTYTHTYTHTHIPEYASAHTNVLSVSTRYYFNERQYLVTLRSI